MPVWSEITGVVACYLGLAYSLYLLNHNVELQDRLVKRLKNPGNFQGAYYELIVANILIRSGFELALEDEENGLTKHCEFSAISKTTGKKYWVEAKMRSVDGYFGQTHPNATRNPNPISHMIPNLNNALKKPAADERLVFIDLNTEPVKLGAKPDWIEKAASRLELYEKNDLPEGVLAFVFVTNFDFHRQLESATSMVAFPFGLGIADFNRPGFRRVSDAYRLKQKYIDVHNIGDQFGKYLNFPATFDGSLPSDGLNGVPPRIQIGETYCFGDPADGGIIGTVTSADVDEVNQDVMIAVTGEKGSVLLKEHMSAEQFADYQRHKDAYFGRIQPVGGKIEEPFEMFEFFYGSYKTTSRDKLLEWMAGHPSVEALRAMSDDDLRYEYCEMLVGGMPWKEGTVMRSPSVIPKERKSPI